MPGTGAVEIMDTVPQQLSVMGERGFVDASFPSPTGRLTIEVSGAYEFRMGCEAWDGLRLVTTSGREIRLGRALRKYLKENSTLASAGLRPWSFDGERFALPTVSQPGTGFFICDVSSRQLTYSTRDLRWEASAWSPSRDEIVFMTWGECRLLTGGGELIGRIDHHMEPGENPAVVGWTPSGDFFFFSSSLRPILSPSSDSFLERASTSRTKSCSTLRWSSRSQGAHLSKSAPIRTAFR